MSVDPRARKELAIPGRIDHGTKVVGVFSCELRGVADADDAFCRIVTEEEGGKSDRSTDRFQGSWWHVDDQSSIFTTANTLELIGERVERPRSLEGQSGIHRGKHLLGKAWEVGPQDRCQAGFIQISHCLRPRACPTSTACFSPAHHLGPPRRPQRRLL